mmetsp:Transcript_4049/g.10214  ORF Transcript_4049/g.10214 Transcript_4049/m.10214 type:complete len:385 (+) Transcript_4049:451-1605(+)
MLPHKINTIVFPIAAWQMSDMVICLLYTFSKRKREVVCNASMPCRAKTLKMNGSCGPTTDCTDSSSKLLKAAIVSIFLLSTKCGIQRGKRLRTRGSRGPFSSSWHRDTIPGRFSEQVSKMRRKDVPWTPSKRSTLPVWLSMQKCKSARRLAGASWCKSPSLTADCATLDAKGISMSWAAFSRLSLGAHTAQISAPDSPAILPVAIISALPAPMWLTLLLTTDMRHCASPPLPLSACACNIIAAKLSDFTKERSGILYSNGLRFGSTLGSCKPACKALPTSPSSRDLSAGPCPAMHIACQPFTSSQTTSRPRALSVSLPALFCSSCNAARQAACKAASSLTMSDMSFTAHRRRSTAAHHAPNRVNEVFAPSNICHLMTSGQDIWH